MTVAGNLHGGIRKPGVKAMPDCNVVKVTHYPNFTSITSPVVLVPGLNPGMRPRCSAILILPLASASSEPI